jgi:hypothetical protein
MTLQSAIDAELPFLRAEAEARMLSTVTVRRKTGLTVQNETTGEEAPEWEAVYTGLPFRSDGASSSDGGSRSVTIGGVTFETATGIGHMPADTTDLADDDFIEVTSGEWAGDVFRVVAAVRYDQKTARRVPIVEATRPSEWS